jgi:hypothetical protein
VGGALIVVQAGGVAIKTLGLAGAVLAGEAGAEEQAVRKIRSKKEEVKWKKESLCIRIRRMIALEQWNVPCY